MADTDIGDPFVNAISMTSLLERRRYNKGGLFCYAIICICQTIIKTIKGDHSG